jgi:ATPase, P-type (transporting), HAD superfamily, subfamily IC
VLALAAAVETAASHPLAKAIAARAEAEGIAPPAVRAARALPGRGAEGEVAGATVAVGSLRLAGERGAATPDLRAHAERLEAEGKTVVAVLRGGVPLGLIALRDEPRADAAEGIARLKAMGIRPLMLTGDTPRTAAAVPDTLGIEPTAGLLPGDKLFAIPDLTRTERVMMVGDSIYEAPALVAGMRASRWVWGRN